MEPIINFLRKKLNSKKDNLVDVRNLDAYKRLQAKFAQGELNYRDNGFPPDALTAGDLVDILSLFSITAGGQAQELFNKVIRILNEISKFQTFTATEEKERIKLNQAEVKLDNLDRTSPLYERKIDLSNFIDPRLHEIDLTHYQGGLTIVDKVDRANKPTGLYALFPGTRQLPGTTDSIVQVFTEVGLPIIRKNLSERNTQL